MRGPRDPLYEALETATAAQDNPISIIISTGRLMRATCRLLIDDGLTGADPGRWSGFRRRKISILSLLEAIRLANPAFDVFANQKEVLDMAASAKRLPSRRAEFENLVLNHRVEAKSRSLARVYGI